jgi:hypothetical protein
MCESSPFINYSYNASQDRLQDKVLNLKAICYYQQSLLNKVFQRWNDYRITKVQLREVVLHTAQVRELHVMNVCWEIWRNAFLKRLIEHQKLERAAFFWQKRYFQIIFIVLCYLFISLRMLVNALTDWKAFIALQKNQKLALQCVYNSWSLQLLRIAIRKWLYLPSHPFSLLASTSYSIDHHKTVH